MKLLLRRGQRGSVMGMGNPVFMLDVRAELTPQEQQYIDRYKLGKTVLYSRGAIVDEGSGLLGLASRLAFKAMNISVSVDDLAGGKRIECKDIIEMIEAEEQIKQAAITFKSVLDTAAHFGGEEVVRL
jgi:hypothetical protein